jgi:phage/plasmid-like protein (TIGR03299 family)
MSHNVETIAWAGETPWHGLGVQVSNDLTPRQMMKKAGVDWEVESVPTYFKVNNKQFPTKQHVLIRKSDQRVLTTVSEDWQPVQNGDQFDFMSEFVAAGDMSMDVAGSLATNPDHGPVTVWALAKVNESFSLFKGKDQVDAYLLFSNPHYYGRCVDIRFTAIRVVCNNTLTLALNASALNNLSVRLNHRKKFDPELVKTTLKMTKSNMDNYKEMAEFISRKKFTVDGLKEYYATVFPTMSKKRNDTDEIKISRPAKLAMSVIDTQPGSEFGKGTWWQAYNSATFAIDHLVGHAPETRLQSAWYGPNRERKVAALKQAVKFAEKV